MSEVIAIGALMGAADKLVKLLCDRGMVDPFDNNPMEVSSSKKWE